MEFIKKSEIKELSNPGVISRQLISPGNSQSERVTVTEVHLTAGAVQSRHTHETSEQIWYAVKGEGQLLLADSQKRRFCRGDIVRFAEGEVHGLFNDSEDEFVYISVTSPPIDFGYAYDDNE